jgi:hypothetical protein
MEFFFIETKYKRIRSFSSVIRKFSKRNVSRYFSVAVVYEVPFFSALSDYC